MVNYSYALNSPGNSWPIEGREDDEDEHSAEEGGKDIPEVFLHVADPRPIPDIPWVLFKFQDEANCVPKGSPGWSFPRGERGRNRSGGVREISI